MNMAGISSSFLNKRYISSNVFIHGSFSGVMLVFGGVVVAGGCCLSCC